MPWQPKAPEGLPTDFDWIRLPSDEWLKGKIVSMYDGKLEFDSDELGVHTFDFADIKELRTSRVVQVGLADRKPVTGRLVLADKAARVVGDTGETAFDRSEILTIVVGARREIDYWSGYANLGGTIRSGNSDQIDYTARLGTVRRSVKDRTGIDYIGNITRINDADTSNNHRVTLGWDRFLTKRLFLNLIGLEWYRDPFQNVANRWTVTAGLGYELVDTARTTWSVTAGPAWQSTNWTSVPAGDDDSASSVALRVGTRFDHEFTGSIDYLHLLQRVLHRRSIRQLHPPLRHGAEDRADRRLERQRLLGVGLRPGPPRARRRQLPQEGRHPARLRPRLVVLARPPYRPSASPSQRPTAPAAAAPRIGANQKSHS